MSRSYRRYDEIGRSYQSVADGALGASEATSVDPENSANPSFTTKYDAGSRVVSRTDAMGSTHTFDSFDAANRLLVAKDALSSTHRNEVHYSYDENGNVTEIETVLAKIATDRSQPHQDRIRALGQLGTFDSPIAHQAIATCKTDPDPAIQTIANAIPLP